jgi:hypothetical protein
MITLGLNDLSVEMGRTMFISLPRGIAICGELLSSKFLLRLEQVAITYQWRQLTTVWNVRIAASHFLKQAL